MKTFFMTGLILLTIVGIVQLVKEAVKPGAYLSAATIFFCILVLCGLVYTGWCYIKDKKEDIDTENMK